MPGASFSEGDVAVYDLQRRLPVSAIVLAGGKGRRIGGNKLFLHLGDQAMLEVLLRRLSGWLAETLLVVASGEEHPAQELLKKLHRQDMVRIVSDRHEGLGPLAGLVRGMEEASEHWIFALGCDMPDVNEAVVRLLWHKRTSSGEMGGEKDAVLARMGGYLEPLHAFYRKACLGRLQKVLCRGKRKISACFSEIDMVVVEEEELAVIPGYRTSFRNLNTPSHLAAWQKEREERN